MDAGCLRHENRRKRQVQRRSVEIEAIPERQNEGDDAARNAETLDDLHRPRERRLARGRRECDNRRLLDGHDELPDRHAEDQGHRQQHGEDEDCERQIQRRDEPREVPEDANAAMPTVGLAMATAFHLLENKEREFPLVRVFGTLGWIAAGILVSYLLQGDTTALPMYVAGAGGLLMGIYSFTLPNVPPPGAGKDFSFRDIAGLDALSELGSRPFVIFMLSVMLTSIPLATYFAYVPVFLRDAGIPNPAFKMTFGQMSEVVCLLLLPWFFMQLGVKRVLIAGMLAWIVRYALFALGAPDAVAWMLVLGVCLHGPCYDFVYVAGQVYVDRKASPGIRAQAQGLFVLATYGVGQGLGTLAAGWIFNAIMPAAAGAPTLGQWQTFWIVPLGFAAIVTALFVAGFREETRPVPATAPL